MGARKAGPRESLRRRAVREARLQATGREEIPRKYPDPVPVQELVKPDDIQRPPGGGAKTDPGIREQRQPYGAPSIPLGNGRRRNSR